MARYRRRYRTIVRAPKKKWASNMVGIDMTLTNGTQSSEIVHYANILAQNKTEINAPVPVIIKTGNFKIQLDTRVTGTGDVALSYLNLYIVFVPQGMAPASSLEAQNLINNHPEWIMAWKMLETGPVNSSATYNSFDKVVLSSRLKRNLNSGDAVYAIMIATGLRPGFNISASGLCQFWTCAN